MKINFNKTCTACCLYISCSDPLKKYGYVCDSYTKLVPVQQTDVYGNDVPIVDHDNPLQALMSVNIIRSKRDIVNNEEYTATMNRDDYEDVISDLSVGDGQNAEDIRAEKMAMFDIAKTMADIAASKGVVPHDIKLSDADLPEAKNFYEFTTGEDFLCIKPYVMQLLIGIRLLAEYCPFCSNVEWMEHDVKVDDTYITFERNVVCLEHGVCPSCSRTKSEMILAGYLNYYNEGAIVAGQRCVVGDTMVVSQDGLMDIKDFIPATTRYGFTDVDQDSSEVTLHNGSSMERISAVFRSRPERVNRVKLKSGHSIGCTTDHPLLNHKGVMVESKNLKVGDVLVMVYNTQTFGNKDLRLLDTYNRALHASSSYTSNKTRVGTHPHHTKMVSSYETLKLNEDIAFCMGIWAVDGINSTFYTVNKEASAAVIKKLETLFDPSSLTLSKTGVVSILGDIGYYFWMFLVKDSYVRGVPLSIRQASKRIQLAYLKGVFTGTGGYCKVKLDKRRSNNRVCASVMFETQYAELFRHISAMLLNIGIYHRIKVTSNNSFSLCIKDENILLFADLIGFSFGIDVERLKSAVNMLSMQLDTTQVHLLRSDTVKYEMSPVESIDMDMNSVEETYDFTLPETHRFVTNGFISSNSGKSALVAMIAAYIDQKLIKLQKPTQVYSLLPNSVLHGTFVALTYSQARDTLWQPLYEYLKGSPWFENYHKILDEYAYKYGEEFYKLKDSFVFYKHRSFLFYPSAPHSKILRGRTRCFGSIDELGLFDAEAMSAKVRTNAAEIHISIERSLLTIRSAASRLIRQGFNDVPTGYFVNVSSPFSEYDKIMQLYSKSQDSRKLLGYKLATWEMNPTITKEDLAEEFEKDPLTAWRDYGVSPSISTNSLIKSHDLIRKCYTHSKSNGIAITYLTGHRKDKSTYRYAEPYWVRKCLYPSVLAIDGGETVNAFAMVCAHKIDDVVYVDFVTEVLPLPGAPVNHTKIFDSMLPEIIDRSNVVLVTADRWNSVKLLSDVERDYDILGKQYSLKYRNFFDLIGLMDQGNLRIPKPSMDFDAIRTVGVGEYPVSFMTKPSDHLVFQMLTVRDTGSKVIKGDGKLNDDLFRAMALAVHMLYRPEYDLLFSKPIVDFSKNAASIGSLCKGQPMRYPGSASNMQRRVRATAAIGSLPKSSKY